MGFFYGLPVSEKGKGKNSDYVQQQNRSLIIKMIMNEKVISRVDLAKKSGLKPATISNIVKFLLDVGIVCETDLIEGKNGRKVVGIRINDKRYFSIIIRVTKAYWNIGIYEIYNECQHLNKVFIDAFTVFDQISEAMLTAVNDCITLASDYELIGIGFVFEGEAIKLLQSQEKSQVKFGSPEWARQLSEHFNAPVYVDRSVNMAAYWNANIGNYWGNNPNYTYLYIQVGYSIECCLMNGGSMTLDYGYEAGDLSHFPIDMDGRPCECGGRGCLTQYISVAAVNRRVGELKEEYQNSTISEDSNIREIIEAYKEGDPLACKVYGELAKYLGYAAAALACIFSPDEICFGDEIPIGRFAEPFRQMIEKHFNEYTKWTDNTNIKISLLSQERIRKKDITMQGCNQVLFNQVLPGRSISDTIEAPSLY